MKTITELRENIDRFLIDIVLAPMAVKLSSSQYLIASMEVSIPTRAMIPNAMIRMVSTERTMLLWMDFNEIRRFSMRWVFMA